MAKAKKKPAAKNPQQEQKAAAKAIKKDALEVIRLRNFFYRDSYRRLLLVLLLLLVIIGVLAGLLYYLLTHRPQPKYFATNVDGGLVALVPLNKPSVSTAELLNWSVRAAASAMTLNYVEYRTQIEDTSDTYFTPQGAKQYQQALSVSNDLAAIQQGKYIVTAMATRAPQLLEQGIYQRSPYTNRYAWQVNVPITITFQNEQQKKQRALAITLLVVRSSTIVDNKASNMDALQGIGVAAIQVAPDTQQVTSATKAV